MNNYEQFVSTASPFQAHMVRNEKDPDPEDPLSSALDPRSSILDPRSRSSIYLGIRPSTYVTYGRHVRTLTVLSLTNYRKYTVYHLLRTSIHQARLAR